MIYIEDNFNYKAEFNQPITFKEPDNGNWFDNKDDYKLSEQTYRLKDFIQNNNYYLFSFQPEDKDKYDNLVCSVIKNKQEEKDKIYLQAGNFIGIFTLQGVTIEIISRFSKILLNRMLNVANNVFLQDVNFEASTDKTRGKSNIVKFILSHLFIQRLEKAYLLGFPKTYQTARYHESKVHGNIDFNQVIKHDIPFNGKISSVTREQHYAGEIVDVLQRTVEYLEKDVFRRDISNRLSDVRNLLKSYKSGKFVDSQVIDKAKTHKSLLNPIYQDYRGVLDIAEKLIKLENIDFSKKNNVEHSGFLIDASELWELYLTNLLRNYLDDWEVEAQEYFNVYDGLFYERQMRPDLVLRHKTSDKVAVFDAKYKRMIMQSGGGDGHYGDLDRSDFYQIHSYMAYLNKNNNLVAGGLLYPLEKGHNKKVCYSDSWFGGSSKFIIDGIDLSNKSDEDIGKIIIAENDFIERMKQYLSSE